MQSGFANGRSLVVLQLLCLQAINMRFTCCRTSCRDCCASPPMLWWWLCWWCLIIRTHTFFLLVSYTRYRLFLSHQKKRECVFFGCVDSQQATSCYIEMRDAKQHINLNANESRAKWAVACATSNNRQGKHLYMHT